MAMKLGGSYQFTALTRAHWERFATDAGLSPAQTCKLVAQLAHTLPTQAQRTLAQFQAQGHHHPVLDTVMTLITQRCALTLRQLNQASGA
ncbi:type II toxin-antitoxin system HipA family toxin [Ideonella livida]|uniref:Type II toxin-antitoxin system HipA family toxin n=1 Tax=Ideonella livida TaxID=2707176 RepID=A0A7C9PIJ9_9BURK|nr:type II toxin-antitoxin system HipA family toxin [Ideonella livida]NDY92111.1 type II toxin-antitoxin system HipA family toxin [Ideonella livida]